MEIGGVADGPHQGNTTEHNGLFYRDYHKVRLLSTSMDTSQISMDYTKIAHHPSPIILSRTRKKTITITTYHHHSSDLLSACSIDRLCAISILLTSQSIWILQLASAWRNRVSYCCDVGYNTNVFVNDLTRQQHGIWHFDLYTICFFFFFFFFFFFLLLLLSALLLGTSFKNLLLPSRQYDHVMQFQVKILHPQLLGGGTVDT